MANKTDYLGKSIHIGAILMFGLTSGVAGCGGSGGVPPVESDLLGVYLIDAFQSDSEGCDQLVDVNPPGSHLVLYSLILNDDMDESVLGAVFCDDVENCRQAAAAAPQPLQGYSFPAGNDQSGWVGWGVQDSGLLNDQCQVDVQVHTLLSTADAIDIQTRTLETVYPPRPEDIDGNDATCRIADAIDNLDDNLPCVGAFALGATFEASL